MKIRNPAGKKDGSLSPSLAPTPTRGKGLGIFLFKLLLLTSVILVGGCQSQEPEWLTRHSKPQAPTPPPGVGLQIINTTSEIIEFQLSGLSWEKNSEGPSLTAVLGTDQKTSYDYGKTIRINYPILVNWRGLATGRSESWAITGVGGTEEKEFVLKGNGLLVIGLSPQYQLNSFYLRDKNATEKEAFQVVRTGHR